MPRGIQKKGIVREKKMLYAAIQQFLENGYERTTTAAIAKAAGMAPSSFFAAFENKEALLPCNGDPVFLYSIETSLQLHITEISEALRELYVAAYTLPTTSEYINVNTAKKLQQLFAEYLPDATEKDFYEMDLASCGITRNFMARPCSMYFTIEDKISRYLSCCLTLYHVPEKKQRDIIDSILSMDLRTIAEKLIEDTIDRAEKGFESAGITKRD